MQREIALLSLYSREGWKRGVNPTDLSQIRVLLSELSVCVRQSVLRISHCLNGRTLLLLVRSLHIPPLASSRDGEVEREREREQERMREGEGGDCSKKRMRRLFLEAAETRKERRYR